jgi:hypothetical protein
MTWMGYRTPNIDRLAREGISFTDYYGQQSCAAGRAAFLMSMKEHPPSQTPGSFNLEKIQKMIEAGAGGK